MNILFSFLKSRTIQGALIIIASNVLTMLGAPTGGAELTELTNHIVSVVAGMYAIWGRSQAKGPLIEGS